MSRLIDAELIEKEEGWLDGICLVIPKQIIYDAPTVEAEPIRHGYWKEIAYKHFDSPDQPFSEEIDEDTGWTFEWDLKTVCSVCGYRTNTYTHYCPDCGAKMKDNK